MVLLKAWVPEADKMKMPAKCFAAGSRSSRSPIGGRRRIAGFSGVLTSPV
jgi:hypothetical protein